MTAHSSTHRSEPSLAGRVLVEDQGQGIRSIRLVRETGAMPDAPDAITQLQDALAAAAGHDALKVVLLSGLGDIFSNGDRALMDALIERGTVAALSTFPYPLIADLPGDGLGPALLLAALCDIVVCSETGHYGWPTDADGARFPTPAEYALAETRFGPAFAAELLTTGRAQTGRALRDGHWCCPVVPEAEVAPHARALAAQLADKSRDALPLLKQHLARSILERSAALTIVDAGDAGSVGVDWASAQVTSADAAQAVLPKNIGKHIAVRDDGSGVLTLTLRRGGKKHDTRAMAQDLQAAFGHAAIRSGHCAMVLISEYPGFLPESAAVADDALLMWMRVLSNAPLPLIAIAGALPGARAWLAMQCCDAVIHQDDGHYDASTLLASSVLAGPAARLFALRLGTAAARLLLLTGAGHSGAALALCSPALRSVPRAAAAEAAITLAHGWTQWPQAAVLAWKAARAFALLDGLEGRADDAEVSFECVAQTHVVSPTPMTLASTVVSATLHPGGIVEVVMQDRASKNMLSPALVEGMAEAFAQISASPACKVVVLTGYDTYFCSGGTKDALRAIQEGKVVFTDDRTFRLPLDCPVPVIAAMQGHGIGAGLSLGLFCDFPLLSEESHYVSPYMTYGFTPGVGATLIVPERFGADLARETLLTACEYEGSALKARGVSLPVHPRDAVRDVAMALAGRLARLPKAGLARMKRHLNQSVRDRLDDICAQELRMHDATFVGRADTLASIETAFGRGEDNAKTSVAADTVIVSAHKIADAVIMGARPAPTARATEEIPLHTIRETLLHMLARELHLDDDEVDPERQYTDLGLDSITGVTWIRKVNERYGLSLDATIVYTYPTIAKLAQHVKSLVGSRDAQQATPDFAELETRKLLAYGHAGYGTAVPQIALPAMNPISSAEVVSTAPVVVIAPAGEELSLLSIRETLQRMLARELHLDEEDVDPERQYTDLGLDSITGVTWIRKVNAHHDLSLDATIVYTYPTIAKLAQHVKSLVGSRDAQHATPDFAELETHKLRAFGGDLISMQGNGIVLSGVNAISVPVPAPVVSLAPISAASTEIALRDTMIAPFRQLTSWRRGQAALPTAEKTQPQAPRVPEDIAVIGMAGQFPMARDVETFWENLRAGVDGIQELSPGRWDLSTWYQPGEPAEGKTNSKWLGQLEDYDRFDPLFFNISPAEARAMDPQQRMFLQTCWSSIEHAGYDPRSLGGSRCGVFVGAAGNDYGDLSSRVRLSAYGFTGNASSILAARIAYLLDLQGPCITIDTACSASLVAIASACDSLSIGSSDTALAGGVYVGAGPTMHVMTAQSGMLSTDGRCYTFDHRANGFVPGEAVGVVMLKRLADAERDGDQIHAVVRGWGVNQDGRTNGITAPNPASQTRLMQEVYRRHRIDPAEIQLIEAHGTGTPLGDPIEIRGLIDAFGPAVDAVPYCALGSVKSNIGHCLTAAGVSAFIKAVLAVKHRELPPTIHFERLNPHIRLEGTPFYVNTALQAWTPRGDARRHAAVSSFGYSGTNAHIVIGEYTGARRPATQLPPAFIVPLSAKTPAQLTDIVRELLAFVRRHGEDVALADLAYTLQVGRAAMEERLGFVVESMAQLTDRLQGHLDGRRDLPDSSAGQAQKHRESLSLIDQDEEFRDALLERWMAQRKYPQLLKLWAKGMAMDWSRLYVDRPRRIALPTYPFARERYWIDTPDAQPKTMSTKAATTTLDAVTAETPEHLFFAERWVEDTAAEQSSPNAASIPGGVVLIAPADLGWTLAGAVRIDAISAMADAVEEANALSGGPITVVCATAAGCERDGIRQLFDLFGHIKSCEDRVRHVLLVGLHDLTRAQGVWDTSWIGFERSLRTAMPALKVSLLFTDGRSDAGPQVASLLRSGGIVAYRDGKRHVLSLSRVASPTGASSPRLKQYGHYLITGGSGALGGFFARFLAETCQADLTLLGRRPASAAIVQQLAALREAGARSAQYVSLDITDAAAVAAWARTLTTPLAGVIHAAGVSNMQRFDEKTEADLEAVLGPKTTATMALDDALRDQPLDIVCYFSSSSAILGDTGACDYAVANRFLMDYANHRACAGLPGKSIVINWPLWDAATSGGLGMGPETSAQTAFYLKSSGQSALLGPDGVRIWQDLLAEDRVQTLVLHGQPSRILPFLDRLYSMEGAASQAAVAAVVPKRPSAPAPDLTTVDGDWREALRNEVRQLIARALELAPERLDDETNLADYGFDSISLTALAKQMQSALSVEVTPALFFNRPNVQGLIEHLAAEFSTHFEARYRVDTASQASAAPAAAVRAPVAQAVSPMRPPTEILSSVATEVAPLRSSGALPIAIVGMSGRFPKAADVDALWTLLAEARSGVAEVPPSRWNWREYFVAPGHRDNRIQARGGGFLDGMDTFDPLFFEVSPAEAEEMDPSERLLMMEAYRAIEDAGIAPSSLRGRNIGVYVGMEESQYSMVTEAPGVTTLGAAMISSRLSYFLDLRGPALATNTACSSGLVALHQAVCSLQQGECEAALAAGVSLSLSPKPWMKMSEAGMLSPDGLCRSFSKHADGIGIGEAVVALLLMPLQVALDRGLPVYGVVRGSGINFDGKTNGVTAPNGRAQEQLIETVYTRHGIDARDVSHVIAHGTGTRLGDPVELNALHNAFKTLVLQAADDGKPALPCAVTSVKSNLGHTMAASGLVSLAALLQGIAHRQIPATLHCEENNDYIAWRDSRLYVNKATRDWDVPDDRLLLGAVSAFGRSGTNAHVVIEEFRDPRALATTTGACLVPMSARTLEQLRQRVEDLLAFLQRTGTTDLVAVARTLQDGRDALAQRFAVVVTSCAQLRCELKDWLDGKPSERAATGSADWRHAVGRSDPQARTALPQRHETLLAAAEAWVQGNVIDWSINWSIPGEDARTVHCRLHLPTYPFAHDRYWIEDTPALPVPTRPAAVRGSVSPGRSLEDILDQVDAGTLAGGEAAAAVKTMSGSKAR